MSTKTTAAMQIYMNEPDVEMAQPLRLAYPSSINCSTSIGHAQTLMAFTIMIHCLIN